MVCKRGCRAASICLYLCLSRSYCVETNHHSGFAIPNLMAMCRSGPPNGASNAGENGNSSPSMSGQSPAAKRILVQIKAQISNHLSFTKLQEDAMRNIYDLLRNIAEH